MRLTTLAAMLMTVAACTAEVIPTQPSATLRLLRPLAPQVAGLPGPGIPSSRQEPATRPGSRAIGPSFALTLGHCGLASPLDFDGSLWNPVAGDDGNGGPLTQDQVGELVNATPVTVTLIDRDAALLVTPLGAIVTLVRHGGARLYGLCD